MPEGEDFFEVVMKAIETSYDGYLFRSRLEARWAVFFKTLNIKYEYEKEGFDIDGVWYLPDFFIPDHSCWIEIKPENSISKKEYVKINSFAKATNDKFILIIGPPIECHYNIRLLANKDLDAVELLEISSTNFAFAIARRASKPELCISTDYCAYNLVNETTDDNERWPICPESAYSAVARERFDK